MQNAVAQRYMQRLSVMAVLRMRIISHLRQKMAAAQRRAMLNAVQDAGITVDEVGYINAHGTSTHHNDLFETRAIKLAFGAHAGEMKVNSTKSMVGHMLGAAGAIGVYHLCERD